MSKSLVLLTTFFLLHGNALACRSNYECPTTSPYCVFDSRSEGTCSISQQTFNLPNNGASYFYRAYNGKKDVSGAEIFCNRYNGTLAIMTNDVQNSAAFASIPEDTDDKLYYIGSNKCVENGEDLDQLVSDYSFDRTYINSEYTNWHKDEPNDFCGNDEDCAAFHPTTDGYENGQWMDVCCGDEAYFICTIFDHDLGKKSLRNINCDDTEFDIMKCVPYTAAVIALLLTCLSCCIQGCCCGFIGQKQFHDTNKDLIQCCHMKHFTYKKVFIVWLILSEIGMMGRMFVRYECWTGLCYMADIFDFFFLCAYGYGFASLCSESAKRARNFLYVICVQFGYAFIFKIIFMAVGLNAVGWGIVNFLCMLIAYPTWIYFWRQMYKNFEDRENTGPTDDDDSCREHVGPELGQLRQYNNNSGSSAYGNQPQRPQVVGQVVNPPQYNGQPPQYNDQPPRYDEPPPQYNTLGQMQVN